MKYTYSNFIFIAYDYQDSCKTIKNEEQAFEAVNFLLSSPNEVSAQGELAKKFYEEHQGVSKLVINELKLVGNA